VRGLEGPPSPNPANLIIFTLGQHMRAKNVKHSVPEVGDGGQNNPHSRFVGDSWLLRN